MAKVIIGIHGLGNKPAKKTLENWWRAAIEEGLSRNGKKVPEFKFELVYWADVLYDQPKDENCTDKENPAFLKEKYTRANPLFKPEDHSTRKKILDFLNRQAESIFLNEDFTLNFSSITDTILQHYFRDLDIYYRQTCTVGDKYCHAREIIRKRTAEVFMKYQKDEIFLIGHSMGSIVVYDVLTLVNTQVKIDTLVTIGSPLGLPVIKGKIAAERQIKTNGNLHLPVPPGIVHNWYNFSDLEDKVAFNYQLSDDYIENAFGVKPLDFVVNNDYTANGERNPHKSYGYLRTPEFADVLTAFLEKKKPGVLQNLWKKVRNHHTVTQLVSRINRNLQHP